MPEHYISQTVAEKDLLACAAYIGESIASGQGRAEAMLAVVPCYLAKGDVDLAAELANTVDDPFTRDKLLILVAEKCAEIDDDEYAMQLVEAMEDFGMQAEGRERVGLIKAGKGQIDVAREIAVDMSHPDFVFAGIAARQSADGDDDAANITISRIEFAGAKVSALLSIAQSKQADEKPDTATKLLATAVEAATEIEHEEEKIRAFCDIGNLFIEAKRNDFAVETFAKARGFAEELDNIHRDAFLAAVSVGFLRAGSQDLADRTLDLVADKTQIAACLLGHAKQFWKTDQKTESAEALEEAYAILKSQREIETRSAKERYGLFTSIATQFAGFEKGERAIEIADGIEDENERMSALSQIATILTGQEKDDLARNALNTIPEDAQRVFALIGMSDAKNNNGDKNDAVTLLNEASHLAESVPQLSFRCSAYNEIAKRFAKYEEADGFDAAIEKNVESITAVKDESIKVTALVELSKLIDDLKLDIPPEDLDFLRAILRDASTR